MTASPGIDLILFCERQRDHALGVTLDIVLILMNFLINAEFSF